MRNGDLMVLTMFILFGTYLLVMDLTSSFMALGMIAIFYLLVRILWEMN